MKEEAFFRVRWKRTPNGYLMWIPRYPFTKIEVDDLTTGSERISDLLLEHGVCTFPVMEFSPRPPIAEQCRRYTNPELCLVWGDDSCNCRALQSAKLFDATPCPRCKMNVGSRNSTTLELDFAPGGRGALGGTQGRTVYLFEGSFLSLFSESELRNIEFRPVLTTGRKRFFELVGPAMISTVGVPHLMDNGWFCSACGFRRCGIRDWRYPIQKFISREFITNGLPKVFTVEDEYDIRLGMFSDRWGEIRDHRSSRGIMSRPLGVVETSDIGIPEVPELQVARHVTETRWSEQQSES